MPMKILIVDDNGDTCQLLHFLFGLKGLTVITAEDGEEGLEKAKAEQPDLIVTDLSMPYMNGVEMIEQIRSDAKIAHTPIVIYTARNRNLIDSMFNEWAERIFQKPIDFYDLLAFVSAFKSREITAWSSMHA
jgi:two-component system, OmpR family, alkaline phosphatase synthesis response regulator PhoP